MKTRKGSRRFVAIALVAGFVAINAVAQYGGGGGTGGGTVSGGTGGGMATATGPRTDPLVGHLNFDRPESWALKYFASASLLSGLTPADASPESRHPGSITVGVEFGWLPTLD